jgi:hypothetical protein
MTLAGSWRRVLADDPTHARPVVSALLIGAGDDRADRPGETVDLTGSRTLTGLFQRVVFPLGWRPQPGSTSIAAWICQGFECSRPLRRPGFK